MAVRPAAPPPRRCRITASGSRPRTAAGRRDASHTDSPLAPESNAPAPGVILGPGPPFDRPCRQLVEDALARNRRQRVVAARLAEDAAAAERQVVRLGGVRHAVELGEEDP